MKIRKLCSHSVLNLKRWDFFLDFRLDPSLECGKVTQRKTLKLSIWKCNLYASFPSKTFIVYRLSSCCCELVSLVYFTSLLIRRCSVSTCFALFSLVFFGKMETKYIFVVDFFSKDIQTIPLECCPIRHNTTVDHCLIVN